MIGRGILWRNLGLTTRLGPIDGRAALFILLAAYHWALWTLFLSIAVIVFLFWVERVGYSIPNLFRRVGVLMMGPHRPFQSARRIRSDK